MSSLARFIGLGFTTAAFCGLVTSALASERTLSDEDSLQELIDAVSVSGGGRVVVPAGVRTIGTVWLKSNVELHLEKGAVLLGSTNRVDYNVTDAFPENFSCRPEEWSGSHLILAYKVENVSITGEGVIDGNGTAFMADLEPDNWSPAYKYGCRLHTKDREWFRPGPMVAMFMTKNIRLEGVTLRNTPCWTTHFRCCDGLDIRNVTIDADRQIANSDGFSIDCTRNVSVRGCRIMTGDDGFAIRASCEHHSSTNFCENIRIENCDVWSCCYGVRFGVGNGLIRNVEIRNVRFHESNGGITFTPAWVAAEKNVFIENVRVCGCSSVESQLPVEIVMPKTGAAVVKDVLIKDCAFEALLPNAVGDSPTTRPENVVFENCTFKMIERLKVGMSGRWIKDHSDRKNEFITLYGKARDGVKTVDCRCL